jgi:hypothetical protein
MKSDGELNGFMAAGSGMNVFADVLVGFVSISHGTSLTHQAVSSE